VVQWRSLVPLPIFAIAPDYSETAVFARQESAHPWKARAPDQAARGRFRIKEGLPTNRHDGEAFEVSSTKVC
jgi:hypothetical protein